MQNLKLERPLVAFDLETTGVNVERDRIVQIALVRVEPGGARRTAIEAAPDIEDVPLEAMSELVAELREAQAQ